MKTIPLTRGMVAIVDDDDYPFLANKKWSAMRSADGRRWYAKRNLPVGSVKPGTILMHREIIDPDDGLDVDHEDRNTLNNQRSNLRQSSRSENNANTGLASTNSSGFKGVSWGKSRSKWQAKIKGKYKTIHLGRFESAVNAAAAYDAMAIKIHGQFARTNQQLGFIPCQQ